MAETTGKKAHPLEPLLAKLRPFWEKALAQLNTRKMSEKILVIIFAAAILLALDYLVFIQPVIQVFNKTLPTISSEEAELRSLRMDRKNKDLIAKNLADARGRLEASEKAFIAPDQLPALLEDLSRLAQDSDVKILKVHPVEAPPAPAAAPSSTAASAAKTKSRYISTPIQISALAGTHQLGHFLAALESGPTFFRVTDLKITASPADIQRHHVELSVETYRLEPK